MSTLHTRRFGDGERVVVGLHGWNGTVDTFRPLAPYLPDSIQLLAVDLPGYGDSPSPRTWTMEAVGESVLATLDDLEVDQFDLLASCSGAFPGFYVARLATGARLDRFVWLEPFAYIPWYLRLFLTPGVGWAVYWLTFGTAPGRWITNQALADRRQADTDMMSSFERAPVSVPYRYLELFDGLDTAEAFADVPGTKHLICGEKTFQAVRESVDTWQSVWAEAHVRILTSVGHLPIEESPQQIAQLLAPGSPTSQR